MDSIVNQFVTENRLVILTRRLLVIHSHSKTYTLRLCKQIEGLVKGEGVFQAEVACARADEGA